MKFAFWQPPPQSGYNGKVHIALLDGESHGMLCGKSVRSSWVRLTAGPDFSFCRTCEQRRTRLKRAAVQKALDGERDGVDADGVPLKFAEARLEYLEGVAAGIRGTKQTSPELLSITDETPLYALRCKAWDAGVIVGRKRRRQKDGNR